MEFVICFWDHSQWSLGFRLNYGLCGFELALGVSFCWFLYWCLCCKMYMSSLLGVLSIYNVLCFVVFCFASFCWS